MAAKQGFLMYYSKGDAIGTKVSVRYRRSGRLSGVVVKRGSTVYTCTNVVLNGNAYIIIVMSYFCLNFIICIGIIQNYIIHSAQSNCAERVCTFNIIYFLLIYLIIRHECMNNHIP